MDWLYKKIPPWATYREFMSASLISLDEQPGLCIVGVGETWCQLFSECVLKVMIPEAKHTCKNDQLCTRMKAGIDGEVHGDKSLWDYSYTKENWGF